MHRVRFYVGTVKAWQGDTVTETTPIQRAQARAFSCGPALVSEKEWAKVEEILARLSDGWTQFYGRGCWQGEKEDTRVYEVLIPDVYLSDVRLNEIAREIGWATGQAAVYYTRDEVRGGLVFSRIKGESEVER
jgi:hypothetical protein